MDAAARMGSAMAAARPILTDFFMRSPAIRSGHSIFRVHSFLRWLYFEQSCRGVARRRNSNLRRCNLWGGAEDRMRWPEVVAATREHAGPWNEAQRRSCEVRSTAHRG